MEQSITAITDAPLITMASEEAIEDAKRFEIELDFSEESIKQVESIISIYESKKAGIDDKNKIPVVGMMYGSYIGEVYIRNYGGKWVNITFDDRTFPGVQGSDGSSFSPWSKVIARILQGEENNLWKYYQSLINKN